MVWHSLARHAGVLAGQLERQLAVVEVGAAAAVVAGQAVLAEGGLVLAHELGVDGGVAVGADGLVERRLALGVAVGAGELGPLRRLPVTAQ